MKRDELLRHTTCTLCGKKIGRTGLPLFWKVTIERHGIDARAVQRQDALGTYLGSHALGAIMGPDEDLTTPMMETPAIATVCEACALDVKWPVAVMASLANEKTEVPNADH